MQICAHCQLPKTVCYALTLYRRSSELFEHHQKKSARQCAKEADAVFDSYMASVTKSPVAKTAEIVRFPSSNNLPQSGGRVVSHPPVSSRP